MMRSLLTMRYIGPPSYPCMASLGEPLASFLLKVTQELTVPHIGTARQTISMPWLVIATVSAMVAQQHVAWYATPHACTTTSWYCTRQGMMQA